MALDWENIIVEDDEDSRVQDAPVTIMSSGMSGHPILWGKIIIIEEETSVEGEEESVMIFASGIPGHSATIDEVTAETLQPDADAFVENRGNNENARFHFGIPRGEKGEPGSQWGGIGGDIADQTDLAEILTGKANVGESYTKTEEDALLDDKADTDEVDKKTYVNAGVKAKSSIPANYFIVADSNGDYFKLDVHSNAFDIRYPILFTEKAIASGDYSEDVVETGLCSANNVVRILYITPESWTEPVAVYEPVHIITGKMYYITGTLSGTSFTPDQDEWAVSSYNSSNNGKYFIPLGFGKANPRSIYLIPEHEIYKCVNGSLVLLTDEKVSLEYSNGYFSIS